MIMWQKVVKHFAGIHKPLLIMVAIYLGQTLEIVSPETRSLIVLFVESPRVKFALVFFFCSALLGWWYFKKKEPNLGS